MGGGVVVGRGGVEVEVCAGEAGSGHWEFSQMVVGVIR